MAPVSTNSCACVSSLCAALLITSCKVLDAQQRITHARNSLGACLLLKLLHALTLGYCAVWSGSAGLLSSTAGSCQDPAAVARAGVCACSTAAAAITPGNAASAAAAHQPVCVGRVEQALHHRWRSGAQQCVEPRWALLHGAAADWCAADAGMA
jgi:hypothetical protein